MTVPVTDTKEMMMMMMMMKNLLPRAAIAGAALATLTACSSATSDRDDGKGKDPDKMSDATNVTVFRNADNVPNLALFCIGPYRFASTLSGGDDGTNKAATIVRLSEDDAACPGGGPR